MNSLIRILFIASASFSAIYFGGCSYRNVGEIKSSAHSVWKHSGFEVVGYEGYQLGDIATPGGRVWYVVKRIGDDRTLYHGFISKWGDEFHIYKLEAIDALKP